MSATFELEKIANYFSNFTNSFARDDRPGKISIDVANHMIHETYFDEFYDHADRYVSSRFYTDSVCVRSFFETHYYCRLFISNDHTSPASS